MGLHKSRVHINDSIRISCTIVMSRRSKMNMNTNNIFPSIHKEMRAHSKMDYATKTVKELRTIAQQKGMKGYWKMQKADLIAKISETDDVKCDHILDAPVPDIRISTSDTWKS